MTPRTVVVAGNQTGVLQFVIPATVEFDPESVVATIDAGGAGATTPELTIADSTGVVIATKRQGDSIPAGDTGSATWALRLDDEGGGGGGGIQFDTLNVGDWIDIHTTGDPGSGDGFEFYAENAAMALSADGEISLLAEPVVIHSDDIELLQRHLAGIFILSTHEATMTVTDKVQIEAFNTWNLLGGAIFVQAGFGKDTVIRTRSGQKLQVQDHLGNPIFEVRDDGSLHGKTGQALTFDL